MLSLPAVFSDNMVFQQKSEVATWGKSSSGNKIRLISSWNEKEGLPASSFTTEEESPLNA